MSTAPTERRGFALITGASSGIGVDLARELAARGHPLLLVARRKERLEALAATLRTTYGVEVVVIAQDLAAPGAASALIEAVRGGGYVVEIVVNNAGSGMQGRFLDMDIDAVEQMFRLNIHALTHLTQAFAREMVARGSGYILNVASAAAFLPSPYVSAYAATKAYVHSFSEALRFELRGTGVSLTTLYPGITTTEFNAVAHARTPAAMDLSILSAPAVARVGVRAMFDRRRAVVPGLINKLNALFCAILPRGLVVRMAGLLMARANGW